MLWPWCCRDSFHPAGLTRARAILTIHNMDNSGECRQEEFAYTGARAAPHATWLLAHTAALCNFQKYHDASAGLPGSMFATVDKALDERTIGERLFSAFVFWLALSLAVPLRVPSTVPMQGTTRSGCAS